MIKPDDSVHVLSEGAVRVLLMMRSCKVELISDLTWVVEFDLSVICSIQTHCSKQRFENKVQKISTFHKVLSLDGKLEPCDVVVLKTILIAHFSVVDTAALH